jgi:hypothetical protein
MGRTEEVVLGCRCRCRLVTPAAFRGGRGGTALAVAALPLSGVPLGGGGSGVHGTKRGRGGLLSRRGEPANSCRDLESACC